MLVRPRWPDRALLRAALAFGAPVVLSNLLSWLGGNLIRFVVHHGAGAVALGLLSVGWGLATRLAGVAAMLVTAAAYPLAVKAMEAGDADGAKRQLSDNSVLLLALLAPTAAGMAVLSAPFTELLVAPQYHAMTIAILPWALLGACIRNLRMHGWDQLFLLCEAPRAMAVLDAVEVAVTLAGAGLGLWWGGVPGAVIGSTVAAALVALGDWLYLRRRFGLQAPFWRYAKVIAAALGMAGALHGFTRWGLQPGPGVWPLLLSAALGAAVYVVLLMLLFPRETGSTVSWVKAKAAGT
jgi:O-antigen/teichoic acid export membrane protein